MKKTIIALALIAALCLSLTACGMLSTLTKKGSSTATVASAAETQAPAADTQAANQAPAAEAGSPAAKLAELGFAESDFLFAEDDYMEIDEDGDIDLYTTASYEQVAKACYDACAKAADDGKVRDYWSEEEIEFTFSEDDFMIWFGYNRGGEFCDLSLSEIWADEETGVNQYLLQW